MCNQIQNCLPQLFTFIIRTRMKSFENFKNLNIYSTYYGEHEAYVVSILNAK